uniref:Tf2-1-like SH3-like domain-containing protein n=1 Tax=Nicotiana tabacum TaxID=4097 RepID=A0A1S4D3Z2_TOBAC|nr:PREDICTED: uncharacterized protein LOC107825737 [Nicotiana tabacum]
MVDEKVLLKVLAMKCIIRFEKRGKLSPRFIGPFEVLEQVGEVAYTLALPPSISGVHPVFHGSMLRRYHTDRSHVLDYNAAHLDESLGYEEEPVVIVDKQEELAGVKTSRTWLGNRKHRGLEVEDISNKTWGTEIGISRGHSGALPHLLETLC